MNLMHVISSVGRARDIFSTMSARREKTPSGPPSDSPADPDAKRRRFLTGASQAAMTAGLAGGYGGFGLIAGRYLYPARPADHSWQFVIEVARLRVGDSLVYRAPSGESVNITRQAQDGTVDDFVALGSTCPHLGCQVHWEPQNERYFCPCHNGTFDLAGVGTGGPPGDAGQSLPRYPLRVDGGLLYIEVATGRLVDASADRSGIVARVDAPGRAGHDPCLGAARPKAGDDA